MNYKKMYDLIYSPITTPYAILENIYLDNYEYIKFYKKVNGTLIGEIKCTCYGDDYKSIFYYYFSKDNYLQRIVKKNKYISEEVFNREREIVDIKSQYSDIQDKQIVGS